MKRWKKLLALTMAVAVTMLPVGVIQAEDAAGETVVLSYGFEDMEDNKTPIELQGGRVEFDKIQHGGYTKVTGAFGKEDAALCLTASGTLNRGIFVKFDDPRITAPEAGSQVRYSFQTAVGQVGRQFQTSFNFNVSNGEEGAVVEWSNVFRIATNQNFGICSSTGESGWKWSPKTWYQIDLVFTVGSKNVDAYINGNFIRTIEIPKIGDYTFNGISMVTHNFTTETQETETAYLDNVEAAVLDGSMPYENRNIRESFDDFTGFNASGNNYHGMGLVNGGSRTIYTVDSVKGKFGKDANDTSADLKVNFTLNRGEEAVQTNPFIYYKYAPRAKNLQYGEKIRVSFQFALDQADMTRENESQNSFYLLMRANSGGADTNAANDGLCFAAQITKGELRLINGTQRITQNWIADKWYRLELIFEPGNGVDVKNKCSAYLDGVMMAENIEFDAIKDVAFSKLDGFGDVRFAYDLSNTGIPGADGMIGLDTYIDEIEFNRASDYTVTPISVTSQDPDVLQTYSGGLLLRREMTVGELKNALEISGAAQATYVDASGNVLEDSAIADDIYLKLENASGCEYFYYIARRFIRFEETFSDYDPIANQPYKGFTSLIQAASSTEGVKGAYAKDADDASYCLKVTDWLNGTGETHLRWTRRNYGVETPQVTTVEFSLATSSLENIRTEGAMNFKQSDGKENGAFVFLQLRDGIVKAGKDFQELGRYQPNQWYKFAFEIDPVTKYADVYMNGEKLGNVPMFSTENENEMTSITDVKFALFCNNDVKVNASSMIDDFRMYAGYYMPELDQLKIDSSDPEIVDTSIEGYLCIPEDQDFDPVNDALSFTGKDVQISYYDDDSYSDQNVEDFGFYSGVMAVVRTKGGAMHYLRVTNTSDVTDYAPLELLYQGEAIAPDASLTPGTYGLALNAEKFNNTQEKAQLVLAKYENGKLVSLKIQDVQLELGKNRVIIYDTVARGQYYKGYLWDNVNALQPLVENGVWGIEVPYTASLADCY